MRRKRDTSTGTGTAGTAVSKLRGVWSASDGRDGPLPVLTDRLCTLQMACPQQQRADRYAPHIALMARYVDDLREIDLGFVPYVAPHLVALEHVHSAFSATLGQLHRTRWVAASSASRTMTSQRSCKLACSTQSACPPQIRCFGIHTPGTSIALRKPLNPTQASRRCCASWTSRRCSGSSCFKAGMPSVLGAGFSSAPEHRDRAQSYPRAQLLPVAAGAVREGPRRASASRRSSQRRVSRRGRNPGR